MGKDTKVCKICGIEQSKDNFYRRKKSADGKRHQCKDCICKAKREWVKQNPGKVKEYRDKNSDKSTRKLYRRNWRLINTYGITIDDYEKMRAEQNGRCAICGTFDPGGEHFHVDHDHETGKIRGLLCNNCNPGLGWFKDNIDTLLSAAQYLRKYK